MFGGVGLAAPLRTDLGTAPRGVAALCRVCRALASRRVGCEPIPSPRLSVVIV